jgi:NAD(P)-dependent dehydrogenase (short-subunit alcohol dehydrogenase family)
MSDVINLSFAGKVALVTAAGSGMGLATAQAFAQAGAAVVLADVNGAAARSAAEAPLAKGHKALAVLCDVADDAQVKAMVDKTCDAGPSSGVDGSQPERQGIILNMQNAEIFEL